MVIKFHVPFLRNMFSVQGLIYDNNASHDLGSFTVDCANGGNDKCAAETASKRNLSSLPTLLVYPSFRRAPRSARIASQEPPAERENKMPGKIQLLKRDVTKRNASSRAS